MVHTPFLFLILSYCRIKKKPVYETFSAEGRKAMSCLSENIDAHSSAPLSGTDSDPSKVTDSLEF